MKSIIILFFLLNFWSIGFSQVYIYVSPSGNDAANGTELNPLKTLEKAKQLVRELKKTSKDDITVLLRGGIYFIDKTLVFGLEDGGTSGQVITWAAYPGETPVISSGLKLSGWTKSKNLKGLPPQARGKVYETVFPAGMKIPRSLFDGDIMLRRSRSKGFKSRIDAFGRDGQGHLLSFNVMYVNDSAELKKWENVQDFELVIRPWCLWTMNNLPIESIDLEERSIKTSVYGTYYLSDERYNRFPDEHAWIENSFEGMTEPGSWCINRKLGKVFYWPKGDTPGDNLLIPVLQEFIRIEGENDIEGRNDIPVTNLVFSGISFKHNDRYVFKNTDIGVQHDWELFDTDNAFFRFRGAKHCILEECEFSSGGGAGIRLDLYCQDITVRNNYIHDIGCTGISLCGYGLGTKDVNKNNTVTNNKITNAGRLYWHNAAIIITQSSENLISHNEISNMPYAGILITGYRPDFMHESRKKLIGEINTLQSENLSVDSIKDKFTPYLWIRELSRSVRWDEIGDPLPDEGEGERNESDSLGPFKIVASYFNMNHNSLNIIEYNEIFNVMTILGDGNGIYISDTGPFNIIRYNFIHSSPEAWGVGIRTDAWQMNTYVFGNIIWKFSGGIASSANNLAFNNIVASCKNTRLSEQPGKHLDFYYDYSGTKEVRFTDGLVMRNVIWHDGESLPYFRINLTEDKHVNNVVDYNFYYWKNHMSEMEAMLSRLRELNIDKKGMILDPMFTDPENGNFNLAPGSPLNKYGFVPLSQDEMGLTQDFPAKFSIR